MNVSAKCSLSLSLLLLLTLLIGSAFVAPQGGPFVLGKADQPLSKEVKLRLTRAYQAQYGEEARVRAIEVLKHKGKPFLAIQTGSQVSPSLAIQLKVRDGKWGFGANAATNTCSGDPCSKCSWSERMGCQCEASGKCNHSTTQLTSLRGFAEVLGLY